MEAAYFSCPMPNNNIERALVEANKALNKGSRNRRTDILRPSLSSIQEIKDHRSKLAAVLGNLWQKLIGLVR